MNPEHSSGKHKAKVFKSALGITASNAEVLRNLIQQSAVEGEVVQEEKTPFGQIFKVDWLVPESVNSGSERVILRTIWEITAKNKHPRLISAFVK